jgi:protein SCO1/2
MTKRFPGLLAFVLAIASAVPAMGHSLEEVDQNLRDVEKYFQTVDVDAPDFALQDVNGRSIRLADLRGKVLILHFIYTSCGDVCPLHTDRLAQIQTMVNQTPMKSMVEFVTITTDPKRDTGPALRYYAEAHGVDASNWMFLTAQAGEPEDSTRKLAAAYGLQFSQDKDGMQMHGLVTFVIDQDGRERARFHGLKFEPVNLVLFVNALTNRTQKPHAHPEPGWWDKIKGFF